MTLESLLRKVRSPRALATTALALTIGYGILQSDSTSAFSIPAHKNIVEECLNNTFLSNAIPTVKSRMADLDERDAISGIVSNPNYQPKYHCDRAGDRDNARAFSECQEYFMQARAEMLNDAWNMNKEHAYIMLTRMLHAQADFYSHSNAWERVNQFESDMKSCWDGTIYCDGTVADRWNILMTQYPNGPDRPHSQWNVDCASGKYDHLWDTGVFCINNTNQNNEVSFRGQSMIRFDVARILAIETCRESIERLNRDCPEGSQCYNTLR